MTQKIHVVTLMPDAISGFLKWGVVGKAIKHNIFSVDLINPRDFAEDVHRTVDDRPYGGGDGMILMTEPLVKAIDSIGARAGTRVYLSPHGERWNDKLARDFAGNLQSSPLTLICGRYGGIDQRFINAKVDRMVSVGDYVLSGGEIAALAVIDSIARFLPGVLGNEQSQVTDSFADGLLEAPQFTRPPNILGQEVPSILRSGDHRRIDQFREALSMAMSRELRPDLRTNNHDRQWQLSRELLRSVSRDELRVCGLSPQILDEIYGDA